MSRWHISDPGDNSGEMDIYPIPDPWPHPADWQGWHSAGYDKPEVQQAYTRDMEAEFYEVPDELIDRYHAAGRELSAAEKAILDYCGIEKP